MKHSKPQKKSPIVIAIDGPAGVGKSSAGEKVASKLGYKFLSTGKMYRALAWKSLVCGIPVTNEKKILELAKKIKWEFIVNKKTSIKMLIDGQNVDRHLYNEFVGKNTSIIAKVPSVRKFMCKMQRELGKKGGIVMEGRDIGTNVFPDAKIKIYLDASCEERARRRVKQLAGQNLRADYYKILFAIQKRDKQDTEREASPLKKAENSYYIDTTNLTLKEVVDKILKFCRKLMSHD